MQIIKREIELQLEPPADSWQVVEGEGQTWIILRSKLKVTNEDITELGEITLVSNTCELVETDQDRFLYRGKIKLQAFYKSRSCCAKELTCLEAAYDEYHAREQLVGVGECPLQFMPSEKTSNSIFLSQLYEDITKVPAQVTEEHAVWQLEIPWQGWLEGGEILGQPEVVVAHLGQIGLETLLCEVLISLTAQIRPKVDPGMDGSNYFLAGEEVAFNLPHARISKVIGSAIKRAFYQVRPGKSLSLGLEYITRLNLVFISSESGGERILSAWGLIPEALTLPLRSLPALPLYVVDVQSEKIVLVSAGEQKVVMKEQFMVTLGDGTRITSERAQPEVLVSLEKTAEAGLFAGEPANQTLTRPRPGEKWLNKKVESTKSAYSQKKVLAIKFGK